MSGSPRHVAKRSRRSRPRPRYWLPLLLALLVALTTGAADAFWTSSGDTSSSGATGSSLPLVVAPGTPSTLLRPGGSADVVLTISNSNPAPVRLTTLALDTSQGAAGMSLDASHSSCDTSVLTFDTQTTGWTVPGASGSTDGTLAVVLVDSLSMAADAASSCQGAQISVDLEGS